MSDTIRLAEISVALQQVARNTERIASALERLAQPTYGSAYSEAEAIAAAVAAAPSLAPGVLRVRVPESFTVVPINDAPNGAQS